MNSRIDPRRLALWRAIEAEYGKPIREVLAELLKAHSCNQTAKTLSCDPSTLYQWRRTLGLPVGLGSKPDKGTFQHRWDFIARYSGKRTPAWIGEQLGLTARQVMLFCQRHGVSPTTSDDLLISSYVADILGCRQQWVVRLIKAGKLAGWRNPGGVWWLVPRETVIRYLSEHGQMKRKPAWLDEPSGWPQVITRRRRCRKHQRFLSLPTPAAPTESVYAAS